MTTEQILLSATTALTAVAGYLAVARLTEIRDQIKELFDRTNDHDSRLVAMETRCSLEHGNQNL